MNERIRELARRVVGKRKDDVASISLFDEQIEQFAELMVKECIEVIRKEVSLKYKDAATEKDSMTVALQEAFLDGHYAGTVLARVKIKDHFGVE